MRLPVFRTIAQQVLLWYRSCTHGPVGTGLLDSGLVKNLSRTCPGPVQDLSRTCPGPVQDVRLARHPGPPSRRPNSKKTSSRPTTKYSGKGSSENKVAFVSINFLRFRGRDGGLGWRPGMAAWRAAYRISLVFGSAQFEFTGTPRPSTTYVALHERYTCTRNHRHM